LGVAQGWHGARRWRCGVRNGGEQFKICKNILIEPIEPMEPMEGLVVAREWDILGEV